jgi:hypothetical protein
VPPTLPLRARSASEIVDAAFQLYRRAPLNYLLISAICYAPILVMQLIVFGPGMDFNEQFGRLTAGVGGLMVLGYWVSMSLMSSVMTRLSSEDYLGHPIEPAVAVRDSLAKLPVVMFALLIKYLLMAIGFIFFIVGAFWFMARTFAVTAAVVLEGKGAFGSIGRSGKLSRGRKLHIFGTLMLAYLIFFVVYFAIAIIAAMTGSVVISTVLTVAASIVAYPLFAIVEMLLYYDARVRNEGYDIEMMAEGV